MSQELTVEDQEKQAREKRKPKWMLAAALFGVYTIVSLVSSVLLIRLTGLAIAVPVILALYGGIVTIGLARLSESARGSADTLLPLGVFGVMGGHIYSPIPDAPIVILLVQFGLMIITYVVYFRMWKGSTEEPEIRQAISSVLGKTSYPNEYEVPPAYKQAGLMLLLTTIFLQIGFVVFKDHELVTKAKPYQELKNYVDPIVDVARSVTASNEGTDKKVVKNLDDLQSIGIDEVQLKPIADAAKVTVAELKENLYQYRGASAASDNLIVYPIVLALIFLPGFFGGIGLMQQKDWAAGLGDTYLGLSVGMALFLIMAFESQIGPVGLAIPALALVTSILGLLSVFKIHRGISDEELKNVAGVQKTLEKAADSPAFAPEEYEAWGEWKKTGQVLWGVTFLEVVCLFLYNTDFFPRMSAGFADGLGAHFPGYALFSLLLALSTGAVCALGLTNRWRWVKGFTEMRLALGAGQVLVYLLLSELIISAEIWRVFPFFLLLGVMTVAYVFLGRTRKNYYQA